MDVSRLSIATSNDGPCDPPPSTSTYGSDPTVGGAAAGARRPVHKIEGASGPRRVELNRKDLERYRDVVGDDAVAEIRDLARELRGLRVLEISSTATGGGVAELLSSLVPLERDVGLEAEWWVITGGGTFFEITKRIHNGLQGMPVDLGRHDREAYVGHNERNALALEDEWDVVLVHDPQPAALRAFRPHAAGRWIWRCHVDSSSPHEPVWEFLRPFLEHYDGLVFTLESFIPPRLQVPTSTILPAIDPLTSKNRALPAYLARETVAELGIDLARPLMLQVSRFDPWKDPLGVVQVWRRVRDHFPDLQLALVGAMASDDPEGWRVYQEIERATRHESSCFLLTNQMGVASHEVNAFQRVADVVVQKSIREGFGLIVAETLWKGTPMVAGRAGGIPVQLQDGVSGYLAASSDEFAGRVVELLEDPVRGRELGAEGARVVRERFLIPRLLRDQLALFRSVLTHAHNQSREGRPYSQGGQTMEHGQRSDPEAEREGTPDAPQRDEGAESVTPEEAVLAARRAREESGRETESTSDFDKVRESGFGA
jgi:trehalose synthase